MKTTKHGSADISTSAIVTTGFAPPNIYSLTLINWRPNVTPNEIDLVKKIRAGFVAQGGPSFDPEKEYNAAALRLRRAVEKFAKGGAR